MLLGIRIHIPAVQYEQKRLYDQLQAKILITASFIQTYLQIDQKQIFDVDETKLKMSCLVYQSAEPYQTHKRVNSNFVRVIVTGPRESAHVAPKIVQCVIQNVSQLFI